MIDRRFSDFRFWTRVIEYVPEFAELKWEVKQRKLFILIGGILITAGVAGELVIEFKASRVETTLRSQSHKYEGLLDKKAGDARNEAGAAIERAGQANERAGSADERAGWANERAAKAEREAASLNKVAEDERLARLKIEERIKPRRLSPRQRESIRQALSAYKGAVVRISTIADDAESGNLGADIDDAVTLAGWQVAFFGPVAYLGPSHLPSGVGIVVGDILNARAVALLSALREQGIDVAIRLEGAEKSGDVIVIVGAKP